MTEVAEPSPIARPARVRRSPTELQVSFLDREFVEALVAERDEPGWLRDDRLAAVETFAGLEVESNRLYTPYVDLRAAAIDGAAPYTARASHAGSPATLSDDIAGLLELDEDGVTARVKSVSPWRCGRGRGDATVIRATPPSRASPGG